jgi:hypothetical protein
VNLRKNLGPIVGCQPASAVALFHQLRVTRPPALDRVEALEPTEVPLLLLHAAIVAAAAATAMATMTGFGERRMRLIS